MGCSTLEVKVSSKYQIVIPKEIRKELKIKKGQKLLVSVHKGMITLAPEVDFKELKGILKEMGTGDLREHDQS